jgi:hypothetical protein
VTDSDLNHYYGKLGMTFKTQKEAGDYSKALKKRGTKNYVTRIINYRDSDVTIYNGIGVMKDGAIPYCKGYLVTVLNNN